MIDWSSFFLGVFATYLLSGLAVAFFMWKAPLFDEDEKPVKEVKPDYSKFDKTSGTYTGVFGKGDYY